MMSVAGHERWNIVKNSSWVSGLYVQEDVNVIYCEKDNGKGAK